jgi:HPt (histidine-containing phosphotransfer) domain-containing protein
MPRFDLSVSLLMLDDDEELLREMLTIFLNVYGDQLQLIRTAVAKKDPVALVKAAHRMKGTLSVFAITELTDTAAALEKMGRHGMLHGAEELFESLERSVLEFAATAQARMEAQLE